uniref:Vomeronasal type-1 receptor n=1 Tax=Castor canadensis TaxID=51338 RepID=A0A8B7TQ43_CASCN
MGQYGMQDAGIDTSSSRAVESWLSGTWLLANTILLLFHILIFILQHKLKLTHLLIGLLALTYLVMLLMSYYIRHTFSILLTFRETFFMGIMVFSGGYMITLLCRHRKQSQHLHSISLSAKASLEPRATQTSLLLMNFFMVISILETIITYSRIMLNDDPILYNIQIL